MTLQFHSWYITKRKKKLIQKDTFTLLFIAALFTIAELWKQPKCPSTDEWIKMWYMHIHMNTHTHTMKYYSVIKNKILSFAATWMDLEGIMLSE